MSDPAPRPFPTPFVEVEDYAYDVPEFTSPFLLHEIRMISLSYSIRSTKANWETKVRDPAIRAKWKAEVLEQQEQRKEEAKRKLSESFEDGAEERSPEALEKAWRESDALWEGLSEEMIDYVLDELDGHASTLSDPSGIKASCFDMIYESDTLVPADVRAKLLDSAALLEDTDEPDWHPNSNEQVLNLVHPSLYCLQYGKTPVFSPDGSLQLKTAEPPASSAGPEHSLSKKHQWLPTDFEVSPAGEVEIKGYINNLHPDRHASVYPVIRDVFSRFVPLFEKVLSDLQSPPPQRLTANPYAWYGEEGEWDWDNEDNEEQYEEFTATRGFQLPKPEPFVPRPPPAESLFKLRGRTVQVIVKLANILLTPEKPDYPGGGWHVEGMVNERIVASGIYYYDQDNITESRLGFRGTFDNSLLGYEQCDDRGVRVMYGIENDGPCVQAFNSLETSHDRAIAFPNVYQHQVSPFSLLDKTKPGNRKILCFFLVDPLQRIPSTTEVPPQQLDWGLNEIKKVIAAKGTLPKLPSEMWDQIWDDTGLMTLAEAKEVRKELMEERGRLVQQNGETVFERPFSLCEH